VGAIFSCALRDQERVIRETEAEGIMASGQVASELWGKNCLFSSITDEGICLLAGETKPPTINSELWHACAGPLVSLPPAGSLVVYFPQGHSEQVSFSPRQSFYPPFFLRK
jgi:hypothetical protein